MKKFLALLASIALAGAAMAQAPSDTFVLDSIGGGGIVSAVPARAYDSASGIMLEQVYETLYTYDGESIAEFVPGLATGFEVSEDGTSYTFTLREDVPFHSGNIMTCEDVEYSYEFGMVLASPEGATSYLTGNQFLGTQVDGSDPAAYQEAVTFDMIDAVVECPDGPEGMTAVINLTAPDPAFIAIQAYTAYSIVDKDAYIEAGFWDGTEETWTDWIGFAITESDLNDFTSGTGAYELVSSDGEQTVMRAFADYWGGAPALQNAVIRYVDEDSTRILNIQQGSADQILGLERGQLVQLEGSEGVEILEDPSWSTTSVVTAFFTYDIDTEANEDIGSGQLDGNGIPSDFFQDVNVRRGFAHLFDQAGFIEQLYEGEGTALTMGLPPSFLGYNEDAPIRTLDLEAAEEYFRAAFDGELWEQGFEFTAMYNAGNNTRQTVLEIMADNLSFINPNFVMNVRSLPWSDFLTRTAQRKTPLFVLGWGADYADPRNFVNTFYSNEGFYSSRTAIDLPEIQELIDQANSIVDPVERAFLYEQVGNLHFELAPLIAVPQQNPFMVVREDLEGVYRNPMLSSLFFFKDISKN